MNTPESLALSAIHDAVVRLDPPPYSRAFILKLFLVTVAALFLPLIFALTLLAFVFEYLVSAIRYLPGIWVPADGLIIVAYVLGMVFFGVVLTFLLRPLYCAKPRPPGVPLEESQQEKLYKFSRRVMDAALPDQLSQIYVSFDVVVDAYYANIKDFKERRLSVHVGLPLLETLSADEYAGLLAHECAHYSELRVRVCFVILRNLRNWCHRVINNEDGWLAWIEKTTGSRYLRWLSPLVIPVRLGINLVNKLFQIKLSLIEGITEGMLHENAFYADFLQTRIIGSQYFDRCLKHLVQVDQALHATMRAALEQNRVPENFSKAVYQYYRKNPLQSAQFVEMAPADTFNSWYFLPPPSSRTRRAQQLNFEAESLSESKIAKYISNLDSLGKMASEHLYKRLGLSINQASGGGIGTASHFEVFAFADEEALLKRFTSGLFRNDLVWEFPEADKFAHLPSEKVLPFLNKVVLSIRHSLPELNHFMELRPEYLKNQSKYHFYSWLIKDGSRKRPSADQVGEVKHGVREFEANFKGQRESYKKFFGVRVAAAVALGKQNRAYKSAVRLIQLLSHLGMLEEKVSDSRIKVSTLEQLLERRAEGHGQHHGTISRLSRMLLKMIEEMEQNLASLPPALLNHKVDVARHHIPLGKLNGADYEAIVVERFRELNHYFQAFNIVISAKLAQFVEMVERKQGIESVAVVKTGL